VLSQPMRGGRVCAPAASGYAVAPPSRMMTSRRFIASPEPRIAPVYLFKLDDYSKEVRATERVQWSVAQQQSGAGHVGWGSFASPGCATGPRGMSAMPPIAPKLMRGRELTRRARKRHKHRSKFEPIRSPCRRGRAASGQLVEASAVVRVKSARLLDRKIGRFRAAGFRLTHPMHSADALGYQRGDVPRVSAPRETHP
jgi:hypothetical protein